MATNASSWPSAGSAAIARGLSRATSIEIDGDTLRVMVVFCVIALVIVLLLATGGLEAGS